MFDDKKWLGDDDAYLAPFARACWGILLMRGRGSWPTSPNDVYCEIESAIPAHGIALWGYASQVCNADKLLKPELAITMAHAFRSVRRRSDLRIRVSKSVWKEREVSMDTIVADLGKSVGPERVFAEWPGRAAVPWPRAYRRTSRSVIVDGLEDVLPEFPEQSDALPQFVQERDAFATDLYLTSTADTRKTIRPTVVAVLVGSDASKALDDLLHSREAHRARCLVYVPIARESSGPWLEAFLYAWNEHETHIDEALKAANDKTNLAARITASTQSFILDSDRFLSADPELAYDAARFDGQERPKSYPEKPLELQLDDRLYARSAATSPIPQPQPRVLDARVMLENRLVGRIPTEGKLDIFLNIRPKNVLDGDRENFPDDRIQWNKDVNKFQIHLLEFGREPFTREIDVPRTGQSEAAHFPYELQNRHIDLRFIVSDGSRMLQTARLQGDPGEFIRFKVESIAAPIVPQQHEFDVALLVNDSLGGEPSLTSLTHAGIELSPLTNTEADTVRKEMLAILEKAVVNPETPSAEVLLTLAGRGKRLLQFLRTHVKGWPSDMTRVQLTTQSDAFFPLEYLYEGPIPDNEAHGICSKSRECLNCGVAVPDCAIRAEALQLCPMGFLGLTAVIERQTWRVDSAPGIWLASPEAVESRQRITELDRVLFSASAEADNFTEHQPTSESKYVHTDEIVKALGCSRPQSWSEWKNSISKQDPSLLILVVHIENDRLHLGAGDKLLVTAISKDHVGNGCPIAITIGCSSGQGKMIGASLPAVLMTEGARVVIAAMTDVLGRHANKAALELALALQKAVSPESGRVVSIGELMTKLRRDLLAAGIALGLALVAYGDADVALASDPLLLQ